MTTSPGITLYTGENSDQPPITITPEGHVLPAGGASCPQTDLTPNGTTPVPPGREVKVSVSESPNVLRFSSWNAPGTLINGSIDAGEQFTHVGATSVWPGVLPTFTLHVTRGDSNIGEFSHYACGPLAGEVQFEDEETGLKITGPYGAIIGLGYGIIANPVLPDIGDLDYGVMPGGWAVKDYYGVELASTGCPGIVVSLGSPNGKLEAQPLYYLTDYPPDPLMTQVGIPSGPGRVELGIVDPAFISAVGTRFSSGTIKMEAHPRDDYSFLRWWIYGAPDPNNIWWYESYQSYDFSAPVFAIAVFEKKPQLHFIVSGPDLSAPCIGYCTAIPADGPPTKKYYDRENPLPPNPTWELVEVTAHEQGDYHFVRWREKGGMAYLDEDDDDDDRVPLDNDADPVTNSTIYIRLQDSKGNPKDRTLEAIFSHWRPVERAISWEPICGDPHGGKVKIMYEGCAGWWLTENVEYYAPPGSEPTGFCDCNTQPTITQMNNWIELKPCDENGNDASGPNGYQNDYIQNDTSPWDRRCFPCSTTTKQIIKLMDPSDPCHQIYRFPHTQRITITEDSPGAGTGMVITTSSGLGGTHYRWSE